VSAPDMNKMGFLTSFFKTESEDIVDTEFVTLDIVRDDEDEAPVLTDVSTGAVVINEDIYTNKEIKPPIYSLARPVDIFQLMRRQPGETEYAAIGSWGARLMLILTRAFRKMASMIKFSIERQASQVLQTGKVSLTDEKGNVAYVLDYKPKATHFPTVSVAWSSPTADPISDISALCDVIRTDGLRDPSFVIMGISAYRNFIKNSAVLERLKKDSLVLGSLNPRIINKGGKYMGWLDIDSYRIDIFTYNGMSKPFGGGAKSKFLDDDKVLVLGDPDDMDFRLVFGGIPTIGMGPPLDQFVPGNITVDGAFNARSRVFRDEKGDAYVGELKSRPICIPVSIDRYGCLDTTV
jgi:hypothetical protein